MNTYVKWCPNVYVAKCGDKHEKGDEITLTTKYGKENSHIVWNYLGAGKEGHHYYSIIRSDGFDARERAKQKAERLEGYAATAERGSTQAYQDSHEGRDFLALGEPIKVGHHSERRHRALIERNDNRMRKCVELAEKAKSYERRAEYWASKTEEINLSMPESIEYYEFKLEEKKAYHAGMKAGTIPRRHSMALQYANKAVKDAEKNLQMAKRLWGEEEA